MAMEPTGKEREDTLAPDFALVDTRGQVVRLSDYRGRRHVVLVFARGFF
jgi:peroxiredoxin